MQSFTVSKTTVCIRKKQSHTHGRTLSRQHNTLQAECALEHSTTSHPHNLLLPKKIGNRKKKQSKSRFFATNLLISLVKKVVENHFWRQFKIRRVFFFVTLKMVLPYHEHYHRITWSFTSFRQISAFIKSVRTLSFIFVFIVYKSLQNWFKRSLDSQFNSLQFDLCVYVRVSVTYSSTIKRVTEPKQIVITCLYTLGQRQLLQRDEGKMCVAIVWTNR